MILWILKPPDHTIWNFQIGNQFLELSEFLIHSSFSFYLGPSKVYFEAQFLFSFRWSLTNWQRHKLSLDFYSMVIDYLNLGSFSRHSSVDPPTIQRYRVQIPSATSTLRFFNLNEKRTKTNKKNSAWTILNNFAGLQIFAILEARRQI